MTSRRSFLTRSGLALGTLIVGDEVLETIARLTHVRTSFPSAQIVRGRPSTISDKELQGCLKHVYKDIRLAIQQMYTPLIADVRRRPRSLYDQRDKDGGRFVYFDAVTKRGLNEG